MPTINLKGVEKLLKEVRRREALIWPTVMEVVNEYVDRMIADAKANAPEDLGDTKGSIGKENDGNMKVIFFVGSAHGAIQEFGTLGYMDVPPELEEEAQKFKGYKGGDFEEFLDAIKAWCQRKGIDENAAYPIAVNILRNGLKPQPFFYPAYRKYKESMLEEIDKRLQKLMDI